MKGRVIELLRVRPGEAEHHRSLTLGPDRRDVLEELGDPGCDRRVPRPFHGEQHVPRGDGHAVVPAGAWVELEDERQ